MSDEIAILANKSENTSDISAKPFSISQIPVAEHGKL
jgi:hypothetical protein